MIQHDVFFTSSDMNNEPSLFQSGAQPSQNSLGGSNPPGSSGLFDFNEDKWKNQYFWATCVH